MKEKERASPSDLHRHHHSVSILFYTTTTSSSFLSTIDSFQHCQLHCSPHHSTFFIYTLRLTIQTPQPSSLVTICTSLSIFGSFLCFPALCEFSGDLLLCFYSITIIAPPLRIITPLTFSMIFGKYFVLSRAISQFSVRLSQIPQEIMNFPTSAHILSCNYSKAMRGCYAYNEHASQPSNIHKTYSTFRDKYDMQHRLQS